MCHSLKCGCSTSMVGKVLVIIGGVNWGLVGLGMLLGNSDWNVVHMLLSGVPVVEWIVYVLVGVAAVMMIFGCKCAKCASCTCDSHGDGKMDGSMSGSM